MIITNENSTTLEFPKMDFCRKDNCNIYQLIFHKQATKQATVFKVRDISLVPVRFAFELDFPDWFESGEYEYYIVQQNEWNGEEINYNIVKNTERRYDKLEAVIGGDYIVIGNQILVTKFSGEDTKFIHQETEDEDICIKINFRTVSDDQRSEAELETKIKILTQGIFKYQKDNILDIVKDNPYKRSDPVVLNYNRNRPTDYECPNKENNE